MSDISICKEKILSKKEFNKYLQSHVKGNPKDISHINLTNCIVGDLPDMASLPNLKQLILIDCILTNENLLSEVHKCTNLIKLTIKDCNGKLNFYKNLNRLTNLRELYIDNTYIKEFRCNLNHMVSLVSVHLINNSLNELRIPKITLQDLEVFMISHSGLKYIEFDVSLLKLRGIILRNNKLYKLQDDIFHLKGLENLSVENNLIDSFSNLSIKGGMKNRVYFEYFRNPIAKINKYLLFNECIATPSIDLDNICAGTYLAFEKAEVEVIDSIALGIITLEQGRTIFDKIKFLIGQNLTEKGKSLSRY